MPTGRERVREIRVPVPVLVAVLVTAAAAVWASWTEAEYYSARSVPGSWQYPIQAALGLPYAVAGGLVLRRRPRDAVGWTLLAVGLTMQLARAETAQALGRGAAGGDSWADRPLGLPLTALAVATVLCAIGLIPVLTAGAARPGRVRLGRGAMLVLVTGALLLTASVVDTAIRGAGALELAGTPAARPAWMVWVPLVLYLAGAVTCWAVLVAAMRGSARRPVALVLLAGAMVLVTSALSGGLIRMLGLTLAPFLVMLARTRTPPRASSPT